jgi:hypothetical protein
MLSNAGGPLPLSLGYAPGLVDIPDSLFTPPNVFGDVLLARMRSNADWNASCLECFYATAYNGDSITLPISPATGYAYQPWECFIFGAWSGTYGIQGGPSASGQIQLMYESISEGGSRTSSNLKVATAINYYVQGGQYAPTNDGNLQVWYICQRGWGQVTLGAIPGFTDLPDSDFAQDSPVTQTIWRQLNQNCKLPRREFFFNNAVPVVSASRGGNLVTVQTKTPHGLSVGDGFFYLYPNDNTFASSPSNALPAGLGLQIGAYVVISVPNATTLTFQQQNGGYNATTAGGRIQKAQYVNGDTVPLPVSSIDGYQYSYAELNMVPLVKYTGSPTHSGPSGPGRIRELGPFGIDPSTGVLSCAVTYYDSSSHATTDGCCDVAVFAQRALAGSPPMAEQHIQYNGTDESAYLTPLPGDLPLGTLTDEIIQELNDDAKEAIARPEFFFTTQGNTAQIALQTSPLDDSTYGRSQQVYLAALEDSGDTGSTCMGSFQIGVTQSAIYWAPDINYAVGTTVVDTYGYYRTVITPGTSQDEPPNWPTPWIALTNYAATGYGPGGTQGQIIIDDNGNQQLCIQAGTSGASQPGAWGTSAGAQTHDGSVIWQFYGTGENTADGSSLVWEYAGPAGDEAGVVTALANGAATAVAQVIVVCSRS